jgi:hypothetical protein
MSFTIHRLTAIATLFGFGFGMAIFPRADDACRINSRLCVTALTIVNGVAASVLFFAVGVAIETSIEHASDPAIASAMVSVIGFFVGTAFFAK